MAELLPEHSLLGMGNPLLDISATVKPELLTKHGLKANDAILTEEETIFNELRDGYKAVIAIAGCATLLHGNVLQVDHLAGGATQNTVRVAQWVLGKKQLCSYMGAVGKDATRCNYLCSA